MLSEEVEGERSDEGEVSRCVVVSAARGILAEVDIEDPVELVFDGPVGSGDGEHALRRQARGEQEPSCDGGFRTAFGFAVCFDHGDSSGAGEVEAACRHDDCRSPLRASMGAHRAIESLAFEIDGGGQRLRLGEKRRSIRIYRQSVIGTGIEDRPGRIRPAMQAPAAHPALHCGPAQDVDR